jgi:hypothetical protein
VSGEKNNEWLRCVADYAPDHLTAAEQLPVSAQGWISDEQAASSRPLEDAKLLQLSKAKPDGYDYQKMDIRMIGGVVIWSDPL